MSCWVPIRESRSPVRAGEVCAEGSAGRKPRPAHSGPAGLRWAGRAQGPEPWGLSRLCLSRKEGGLSAPREEQIWFGTYLVLRGPPIIEARLREERSVGSVSGLRRASGPQHQASPAGASTLAWALPAAPEPDEAHVGPSGSGVRWGLPFIMFVSLRSSRRSALPRTRR